MLRAFRCCLPAALLLAGHLAGATPLPPDSLAATAVAPPRLTLNLATATRTTYLQRAPMPENDKGYLGTTLTYQAPQGFMSSLYLNHSYNFQTLGEPYINLGELMVGWQSVNPTSNTYWSVQYAHLFSYGESALVQASLRNSLEGSVSHYFDFVTASATADLFLGSENDFVLTFDVSHPFRLPVLAHDTLSIEPTVELGAGSQHFYATSLATTTRVRNRKRGTVVTTTNEPSTPGFSALGYTLSLPITLDAGRFSIAATPSYLIPLHVPTGGYSDSFFYFTLSVSRTFW